jgi:hypothetical protein
VPSALRETVQAFEMGNIVPLSVEALTDSLNQIIHNKQLDYSNAWEAYIKYASWDNHVAIVLNKLNKGN